MLCFGIRAWRPPIESDPLQKILLTFVFASVLIGPTTALAQTTIYKQRDTQGRLIFSDRPISKDAQTTTNWLSSGPGASDVEAPLPAALGAVVTRYPVMLYTAKDCPPCEVGRTLLKARGIPFSERTVFTPEDGQALSRLSGGLTVPLLTIGSQQLKGFSETSWTEYLSAAGYPAQSALPPGYRYSEPRPLVDVQPAQASVAPPAPVAPVITPAPQQAPSGQNPAGIIF